MIPAWPDLPDYLAMAIGAWVIFPFLLWRYGPVRLSGFYMNPLGTKPPETPPTSEFGWWVRLAHGLLCTVVFSLLILGLVLRGVMYGMDGVK